MGTNKTHFNSRQKSTFYFSNINMKPFIALSALAAAAMAAPTADPQYAGPVHAAVGDLVATRRGYRPVSLEGFSEDDNQDGFVDPVGQVAPLAYAHALPAVAPYVHAPLALAAATPVVTKVEKVEVEAPKLEKLELPAAPIVSYAAAPAFAAYHHAPALVHTSVPVTHTHTVPVSRTYTQTVPLGVHRTVHTTHHVGGLAAPLVVAAAPAEAEAAEE